MKQLTVELDFKIQSYWLFVLLVSFKYIKTKDLTEINSLWNTASYKNIDSTLKNRNSPLFSPIPLHKLFIQKTFYSLERYMDIYILT